jgi:hypothetical protein
MRPDSSLLLPARKLLLIQQPRINFNNLQAADQLKNSINPRQLLSQLTLPVDFKAPMLAFGKTDLSLQANNTSTSADNMESGTYQSTVASTGLTVWNIPFSVGYNSQSGLQHTEGDLSYTTANFDKDKFLDQIKERIKKLGNPEDLFRGALSQLYAKRDQVFSTLRNELTSVVKTTSQQLLGSIQDRINVENISRLGVDQFLNNIVEESRKQLSGKQELFLALQNKAASQASSSVNDSITILAGELDVLNRSRDQLESEIGALRDKWIKNGTMETIAGFEKEKQSALNKLMNDPEAIAQIASQKLKLPGLQRLLIHAKTLNIGASGIKQSSLGLNDVLLKGISMAFQKGKRFLAPVMGKQPGIKSIADFAYSNFNELPNILTTAIRMGKGDMQKDFSHVSLALFQQNSNQSFLPTAFQTALPKNLVTTFSKRMSFGESHHLLTEISKSTMLYNPASGGDGGLKNIINTGNLFGNMGVTLDYSGEFEQAGLSEKLVVRYTGKEYNNLGNFSLVSGAKEISNDLKKYFLNRKLIVNVRAHYREYEFSIDDGKWSSFSYLADLKWKMKKGEFVELRYQPYFNRRNSPQENYLSSKSHRLALRGAVNRKVGKGFTYRNFMELASSRDNFYDIIQDKFNSNGFISFTSLQTLLIGKQTLFVNITGNHARQNQGYLFGNSSVSLDAGITFSTTRKVSLSSALVYNEVNQLYGQVAIRQSVSALLGKRIVLDGFLHAGKNLYEPSYLRIPAVTGNLSISYNLK